MKYEENKTCFARDDDNNDDDDCYDCFGTGTYEVYGDSY